MASESSTTEALIRQGQEYTIALRAEGVGGNSAGGGGGGGGVANKLKDGGSVTGGVSRIAVPAPTTIICLHCTEALAILSATTEKQRFVSATGYRRHNSNNASSNYNSDSNQNSVLFASFL